MLCFPVDDIFPTAVDEHIIMASQFLQLVLNHGRHEHLPLLPGVVYVRVRKRKVPQIHVHSNQTGLCALLGIQTK